MALSALRNALARTVAPAQRATLASASTVTKRSYHENVSVSCSGLRCVTVQRVTTWSCSSLKNA